MHQFAPQISHVLNSNSEQSRKTKKISQRDISVSLVNKTFFQALSYWRFVHSLTGKT